MQEPRRWQQATSARASREAEARLRRLRGLAWLLDRAVGAGDKVRFGLDPIIGLVPGIGDWIGGVLSLYVVYEAVRLGMPWPLILRMLGNVAVETVVGVIPLAGDVFDFFWQANMRNLRLVERHYSPQLAPRSLRSVSVFLIVIVVLVIATMIGAIAALVWFISKL